MTAIMAIPATEPAEKLAQSATLQETLSKHIVLIDVSIHNVIVNSFMWQISRKGANELEVILDGQTIPVEQTSVPAARMFECCPELIEWRNKFLEAARPADSLKNANSIFVGGVRVFPLQKYPEYVAKVLGPISEDGTPASVCVDGIPLPFEHQAVARQLQILGNQIADEWADVCRLMESHMAPILWDRLKDKLPTADQVRIEYRNPVRIYPTNLGTPEGAVLSNTADILHYKQYIDRLAREECQGIVQALVEEPRKELAKALEAAHTLINRDGRITTRTFEPVRRQIEKLKQFSFIANSEMIGKMDELMQRLGTIVPSEQDRITAHSNGLMSAIESVMEEVQDADKQAADIAKFGGQVRGIRLS